MENQLSSQTRRTMRLRDSLKLEKPNLSGITKNADNVRHHQKRRDEMKTVEKEELVKYMSSLPSYLENGKILQERAFSVGVLDWRQLEKWQRNNKQMPYISSGYSPSSCNTSFFSTDGSSTHSSTGQNFSPARHRMHRPTLEAHLKASPNEAYSLSTKEDAGKFQNLKPASRNPLRGKQSVLRTYQSFDNYHSESKPKECKRREGRPPNVPKLQISRELENCGGPSLLKGKTKIQDGESTKRTENYPSEDNHCTSYPSDSTTLKVRRSSEASRRSHLDDWFSEGAYHSELYSGIAYSCPLPCDVDSIKNSQTKQTGSVNEKSFKILSEPSHVSAKTSISTPKSRNVEEKRSTTVPTNLKKVKSSKGPDPNVTVKVPKLRNPSPTRRFSFGMGKIGRSFSSKDSSEGTTAPGVSDKSTSDKSNAASRFLSSPLRRLLDPLLKPKASNSHYHVEPSKEDSQACKSDEGVETSTFLQPLRVKFDMGNSQGTNLGDLHQNEKNRSSKVQAFLQIAIKNGLPLFTFAVGSNSEILAATVRQLTTPGKNEKCAVYTFFTVSEVKKKKGWMNQGSKGKGNGYVPNIVAQMKVSDSEFSNLTRHESTDRFRVREFVLFSVELRREDQQIPEFQPNDELAAIVVKLPKGTFRGSNQDGQQKSDDFNCRSPPIGLKEPLPVLKGNSNPDGDFFSTKVVLPGGVHGLPSKGEPSPLLERWRLGGLCDCGGWDEGCRLRVLSDQTRLGRRLTSSKPHPIASQFELFSKGEEDDRPFFSLSPFNDGIFSVEFNSSLTHLQAFAICVAVINSGKPFEISELIDFFEDKFSEETTFVEDDETKAPNPIKVEVPARYASYPPHSPVGRV